MKKTFLLPVLVSFGLVTCGRQSDNQSDQAKIRKAPELFGKEWINSPPLMLAGLRGKVVLIEFWEYTCINCLRTLPHVKAWHKKYASKGLVVIGVHTPEFESSAIRSNVEKAVRELGISYPVLLDNAYFDWNAYDNNWWPRLFLIDKAGNIRYDHIGEGRYARTEAKIQELLQEAAPKKLSIPPDSA